MTELERAEQTRDAIYWSVHLIKREDLRAPPLIPNSTREILDAVVRMHELWKREVNILKAAEKGEEPDRLMASPHDRIDVVNAKIDKIGKWCAKHQHDFAPAPNQLKTTTAPSDVSEL